MSLLPLQNILILEFCQYMAGPVAGLKLADLGARVIKIERPGKGEAGRQLAVKNLFVDGDSLIFHTFNRNKESYAADLKNPDDLAKIHKLIGRADVLTHNFRPGVMEKIGLDYPSVRKINPRIVYAVVTGYGSEGPWAEKPGQDLLVQALSGLTWLTGKNASGPVPFGLAIVDTIASNHLSQGILAALLQRSRTGAGALVEVSLLESILDLQFEVLTTYLNDGGKPPVRPANGGAHAYLGAPYGIYATADGYLALAMGDLRKLAAAANCAPLLNFLQQYAGPAKPGGQPENSCAFERRDAIMKILADFFATASTQHWLDQLEPAGVWCSAVLDYRQLLETAAYSALQMEQTVSRPNGTTVRTTRCPIRIDGQILRAPNAAPHPGEHNQAIEAELLR